MNISTEIQEAINKLTKYKGIIDEASVQTNVLTELDKLENKKVFTKEEYDFKNKKQYQELISLLKTTPNNGGIYLFEFKEFTDKEIKDDFIKKYKERKEVEEYKLSNINEIFKYDYLYIGKNEKNIDKRILEHLDHASNSTYAMKLNDDNTFGTKSIIKHLKLTIYYIEGEVGWIEKLILSLLKKELHNIHKPMIGGSRA